MVTCEVPKNIFHTKCVKIAEMSTLYFVNICFSSSDISLLFCYFKYSLCFRIIFPSQCKQMPGKKYFKMTFSHLEQQKQK